ncbi:CRAL/TRIO domain-containing protein [Gloeophyllum trabeum ATCC 11539]|uniref:Phosphatidylinositol transfer protein SFH5 n=1 Tax=Gloeophyllum trabeum (strain ATCC 11539 / FP-39264 / Madison 617) TaxID=670483 RepID=S7RPV9_GLOTA|nr:CRAL/TRIO domain-containing protein [Gloeophyllum trabeum ATCC 11539]EPQ56610.1 CRAL/TRIO domain-containing protein [Gloeophyllum trabeum ATCC 11539]
MVSLVPATTDSPLAPATTDQPVTTKTAADPEPGAAAAPTDSALHTVAVKDPQPEPPAPQPTEKPAEPEEPEPQNALTKQFTEQEWAALKEFRKQLPEILADAYPEKHDVRLTPITLWGVELNPNGVKSAKESVVLMKFLRARNLNVSEAREMLVNTLRWRESFKIEDVMKEEFDDKIFGRVGHIYGKDKEGRPVVYNVYGGNTKEVFSDVQRFIRWRVQFMEKAVMLLDFENIDQTLQIHDYEGVGLRSRDANSKNAASEATNIFGSHYPELLYKKFFVNVPSLMTWIFWLFKPLMSANTLAKMSVVGSGPNAIGKALLPHIDAKELPKKYGGEAPDF